MRATQDPTDVTLQSPTSRGLLFVAVGVALLANVGHLDLVSPGDERFEYQRVTVTVADEELRFTADDQEVLPPESLAGIGCDGSTDTSGARLCAIETWLLNGTSPPRTLTIDRPDEFWATSQGYTTHHGEFYERARTTHNDLETVPEGQIRLSLVQKTPEQTLDAIAVPIESAPPELRRVIRQGSATKDHYVHGAEIDTGVAPVPANEYEDGGTVVETNNSFVVVTTEHTPGWPALRVVASAVQWLFGLALVASGGHRYLTNQ